MKTIGLTGGMSWESTKPKTRSISRREENELTKPNRP